MLQGSCPSRTAPFFYFTWERVQEARLTSIEHVYRRDRPGSASMISSMSPNAFSMYEYACSSKGRTMPFQSSSAMSLFPLSCSAQMKLYICLCNASAFSAHSSALTRIGSISAFSILPGIINKEINIASSFILSSPGQG